MSESTWTRARASRNPEQHAQSVRGDSQSHFHRQLEGVGECADPLLSFVSEGAERDRGDSDLPALTAAQLSAEPERDSLLSFASEAAQDRAELSAEAAQLTPRVLGTRHKPLARAVLATPSWSDGYENIDERTRDLAPQLRRNLAPASRDADLVPQPRESIARPAATKPSDTRQVSRRPRRLFYQLRSFWSHGVRAICRRA